MDDNNLVVNNSIVWALAISNIVIVFIGAFSRIYGWADGGIILTIGITVCFAAWVIILSDIANHRIRNKSFWILLVIVLPSISPILYLILREGLINPDHPLDRLDTASQDREMDNVMPLEINELEQESRMSE